MQLELKSQTTFNFLICCRHAQSARMMLRWEENGGILQTHLIEKELQVALKIAKRSTSPIIQDIEIPTILRYTISPSNVQIPTVQGWIGKVPVWLLMNWADSMDNDLLKCIPIWNAHSWPYSSGSQPTVYFSHSSQNAPSKIWDSRPLLCSTISSGSPLRAKPKFFTWLIMIQILLDSCDFTA